MSKLVSAAVVGAALIAGAVAAASAAEQLQEVTVQATRVIKSSAGHTASGIPIVDTSLSYGVSYADLNLAAHADVLTLQKRIKDAAAKACKQLVELNPTAQSQQSESDCTKTAADKALAQVDVLVATAAK